MGKLRGSKVLVWTIESKTGHHTLSGIHQLIQKLLELDELKTSENLYTEPSPAEFSSTGTFLAL